MTDLLGRQARALQQPLVRKVVRRLRLLRQFNGFLGQIKQALSKAAPLARRVARGR